MGRRGRHTYAWLTARFVWVHNDTILRRVKEMFRKQVLTVSLTIILIAGLIVPLYATAAPDDFVSGELAGKGIRNGKPLQVGIAMADLYSEFTISMSEYARWMLQQAGAKVTVANANFDTNAQMSQLMDFIERRVDVVVIQPTDCEAIAPAIERVNAAGIPVIAINRPVNGKNAVTDLGVFVDDVVLGRKAAEFAAGKAQGTSGKVLTVQGVLATANARDRAAGFSEVDSKNDAIRVVSDRPCDWKAEDAMAAVVDIMATNPDLFAVFSHSDCMLPGVVSGLKQGNRFYPAGDKRHVVVVSVDGDPFALDQIRKGYVDATVENSPLMLSVVAVKGILTRIAKGLPLGQETIMIDPVIVTNANVDDPSLWGNFDVSKNQLWPMTETIWNSYLNY